MSWTKISGVAAGVDGMLCVLPISDSDGGKPQTFDRLTNKWTGMGDLQKAMWISVGSRAHVWALCKNQIPWRYLEEDGSWHKQCGALCDISVGADGAVWGVNGVPIVYVFDKSEPGDWKKVAASDKVYIQKLAVVNRMCVWGLTTEGRLVKYNFSLHDWQVKEMPISTVFEQITASAEGEVWAIAKDTSLWMRSPSDGSWAHLGSGYMSIAVGSDRNAWAVDTSGHLIDLTVVEVGSERWGYGGADLAKRWDSKDRYDPLRSTHLWMVCKGAEAARNQNEYGTAFFHLFRPSEVFKPSWDTEDPDTFRSNVCDGLWDADAVDPYRDSTVDGEWAGWLTATYKSHFYDPDTGLNWLDENTPTALTQCVLYYKKSIDAYKAKDMKDAGYQLGLTLHYLTDVTQPMHASNFTYLSSYWPGYHGAVEEYAIDVMKDMKIEDLNPTRQYSTDPGDYVKAAARKAKARAPRICSSQNLLAWNSEVYGRFHSWKDDVVDDLKGALSDGVSITGQFLVAWMTAAMK